jgi:hypothetical protein
MQHGAPATCVPWPAESAPGLLKKGLPQARQKTTTSTTEHAADDDADADQAPTRGCSGDSQPTQSQSGDAEQPVQYRVALQDIPKELKQMSEQRTGLGQANLQALYYKAYTSLPPDHAMLHQYSHACLRNGQVPMHETRKVLEYRSGTMYTEKLAYRYNHTDSSKCKLCGEEDGAHHTVSGCSDDRIRKMVTERHNRAARLVAKATLRGSKGAWVGMIDAGSEAKCRQDEMPRTLPHRIPEECLPQNLTEAQKDALKHGSVPDIFIYQPPCEGDDQSRPDYYVVEVKYCRDTDPTLQLERGMLQHKQLCDTLESAVQQEYGPRTADDNEEGHTNYVHHVPIMLGVAGALYASTEKALQMIGVNGTDLHKLLKALHRHAVSSLAKIYRTKRRLQGSTATKMPRRRNKMRALAWTRRKRKRLE